MLKITAIQDHIVYNVHFRYDPYLVELVRQIPGRAFIPEKKFWTIPSDNIGWLQRLVEESGNIQLDIITQDNIGENANIDETTQIPDIDISDVDQYVESGSKLFPHQIDFLNYAKAHDGKGFILGDSMGLGKKYAGHELRALPQKSAWYPALPYHLLRQCCEIRMER